MKVTTPEISWHERDPIYSVDFQPGNHLIQRLASGGVDKIVRIWQLTYDADLKGCVEFLSNLRRHTAAVNVVRFSKNGEFLASAGDDSAILIWKLSDVSSPSSNIFSEEEVEEDKESWVCHKTLRGHLGDVQDLSWSKDSRFLVSGSVDNSAIVWDVKKAQKIAFFNEHKSYVQGVTFDPLGDFIATLSSDRSMRIFNLSSKNCIHNVSKMAPILVEDTTTQTETKPKSFRIFHDDGLRSFFRRLEFSSDGHLLFTPAGCVEVGDKVVNCSFVFVRGAFSRPALYLPSGEKATTVIRANPQLFKLRPPKDFKPECESDETPEWESHKSLFSLPYRIVFAVATDDSVLLYDSQQTMPIALMKNIHYHQISDLSWTTDGQTLIISSTDGFCTIAMFDEGELGIPYSERSRRRKATSQNSSTVKPVSQGTDNLSEVDDSPETSISTELPFSRYTEDKQKANDTKPEINTTLNIRRVKTKTESNGEKNNESPKINTTLNIRKVKKEETPLKCDDDKDKKSPKIDEQELPLKCDDDKDKKSPKIDEQELPLCVQKMDIEDAEMKDESHQEDKLGSKKCIAGSSLTDTDSKTTCDVKGNNGGSTQGSKKRIQLTTLSSLK